jgi:hypothetical protein
MMDLDKTFYPRAGAISWLSHCGEVVHPAFDFPVDWVDDRTTALQLLFSRQTANAMTAAQGDLTGFLAKYHYSAYSGHWNKMAHESRDLLERVMDFKDHPCSSARYSGLPCGRARPGSPDSTDSAGWEVHNTL